MVSGLARCSFGLRPACSLTRFRAFCTKGFEHFIASMLASAATGWSVSCRVGLLLSHWSSAPFHGAPKHALSTAQLSNLEQIRQKLKTSRPNGKQPLLLHRRQAQEVHAGFFPLFH